MLDVVVCGSFRRELGSLREDVDALRTSGCRVLSPVSLDFATEQDGFVYLAHELGQPPAAIEALHLKALLAADLVWLHSPDGYVGPSGAFELGVAQTAGIPVFARDAPSDVTLRNFVTQVDAPKDAASQARSSVAGRPGSALAGLQSYYARVSARRGWDSEGPTECMLLLTEELGELARAVRRVAGIARHGAAADDAAEELADVQLYIVHLANILDVDLATAVTAKERRNAERAIPKAAAA